MSEQVTARLSDEGTSELRVCLNLPSEHVDRFDLTRKKFVRLRTVGTNRYKAVFQERKDLQTQRWQVTLNKKKNQVTGATLQFEPSRFKLTKDEKVLGVPLDVEVEEDGIVFTLDPENFAPRPREVTRIKSKADKVAAGFTPPSAWGEQVQMDIEEAILERIEAHMYRKYGGKRL